MDEARSQKIRRLPLHCQRLTLHPTSPQISGFSSTRRRISASAPQRKARNINSCPCMRSQTRSTPSTGNSKTPEKEASPQPHCPSRFAGRVQRCSARSWAVALIVALGRTTELIGEQIVTLQLGERPRLLPLLAAEYSLISVAITR